MIKVGDVVHVPEDAERVDGIFNRIRKTYRIKKLYPHFALMERNVNGHVIRRCMSYFDINQIKNGRMEIE